MTLTRSYTTRRSQPMMRSRLRSPTSKSITTVLLPRNASPVAMAAALVVLPTPPLPEVTTMILAKLYIPLSCLMRDTYRATTTRAGKFSTVHHAARLEPNSQAIAGRYPQYACNYPLPTAVQHAVRGRKHPPRYHHGYLPAHDRAKRRRHEYCPMPAPLPRH